MIDFREIRARVPAQDAARFYGATFDRRGWAICPFHGDKHPSVSFKGGRFRCWACGANGDSLDFTARLFNLDSVQAAEKLNQDFSLRLDDRAGDSETSRKAEADRRAIAGLHEQFEIWRGTTINRLNEVSYVAHMALKRLPAPLSDREALAIRYQARAAYLSDLLEAGTPQDQAQIYRERVQIAAWIDRVLKSS